MSKDYQAVKKSGQGDENKTSAVPSTNGAPKRSQDVDAAPPFTRGPWKVRAATFCNDGIPSYEVVMPGDPQMNAVDARLIGAAPMLYVAAKTVLDLKWIRDLTLSHRPHCQAVTLYDNKCDCGLRDYLATDAQLRSALAAVENNSRTEDSKAE